ncbi:hypothetical protein MASR2M79_03000 [Aminivibrio sp.]
MKLRQNPAPVRCAVNGHLKLPLVILLRKGKLKDLFPVKSGDDNHSIGIADDDVLSRETETPPQEIGTFTSPGPLYGPPGVEPVA